MGQETERRADSVPAVRRKREQHIWVSAIGASAKRPENPDARAWARSCSLALRSGGEMAASRSRFESAMDEAAGSAPS